MITLRHNFAHVIPAENLLPDCDIREEIRTKRILTKFELRPQNCPTSGILFEFQIH